MNILLVNRSDRLGGAAIVTSRLMKGLNDLGAHARMLVINKLGDDDHVAVAGGKWANRYHFLAERLAIFCQNGLNRNTLFKIDTATHGLNLAQHPWVKQADVIVLGWVNQGMLSLKNVEQLASLGKPLVWVMHDMWNGTGICHHAGQCRAYENTCGKCPLTGKQGDDISTTTQRRKQALYNKTNIHFVAVSNWLASKCRESSVMGKCDISVIANAFPVEDFSPHRLPNADYGINPEKKVLVMGAARLDDSVKGFDQLIAITRHIAQHKPQLADKLRLLLFGAIRDENLLNDIALPYTYLGMVNNAAEVYAHADVVLSTSLYETLPGTLIEGQASGCVPVTFGEGGQADIVDHMTTGYIAQYLDPESFASGIEWAINADISREMLHDEVTRKFAAAKIAQQHLDLYSSLHDKKSTQ